MTTANSSKCINASPSYLNPAPSPSWPAQTSNENSTANAERLVSLRKALEARTNQLDEDLATFKNLNRDLANAVPGEDPTLELQCYRNLFDSMRPRTLTF